ncbi:MAG: glycosyltransferase, partial [Oscillospiraceae bacterium]|nr:glycosyltransferase [Oscillospiraceae bacterium]
VMANGVDVPRGGVDDATVVAATAEYDLPHDVPMFLFVGRLMWYKGLRIILDALAALKAQGTAFRMVFIGDGADGKEVRATAHELGLDDVCFFTGAISDRETIRGWYTRADLFLFPSTFDTNGLVVREAAASATATVMVAGSCAAEGVTDGQNGFFIEENAPSLAAKLTALCADRDAMRRVGENAQSQLYLSWEDAVARAYERYEIVIDDYRSGKYPKHQKAMDGFLNSQGELMDTFALLEEARDELRDDLTADRDELVAKLHEGGDALRAFLRGKREEAEERLEDWWRKMDRYL